VNLPEQLGLAYLVSEVALRFSRRSGDNAKKSDGGSLALLWASVGVGIGLGICAAYLVPAAGFSLGPVGRRLVVLVFLAGLALRWWAILSLGKFFTVDVAIATDHQLVVRGPYRWMRHPSYTGMMLAFVALAATFQNWLSLVAILVPVSVALAYRIRIEETALISAFGDEYRRYAQTTKRLIPGVV
jgi:protein-S-isoprenylcysteine O-methyltransferase